VLALLFAALGRRGHVDAPPPPPPLTAAESALLAQAAPFDLTKMVKLPGPPVGAAFSVADSGVWLTAASVVAQCAKLGLVASGGEGVIATVAIQPGSQVAVLTTPGGAPALPLARRAPPRAAMGYYPGFPTGQPGEVATQLLGPGSPRQAQRDQPAADDLVWAEVGRTEGLRGSLSGLIGAPVLDDAGRAIGVTLAIAPRRGELYTTTPQAMGAALAAARQQPSPQAAGVSLTPDNYGLAADDLRRSLRIAPVVCAP
jgi:hypothetical protein